MNRQTIQKAIGLAVTAWTFRFGVIRSDPLQPDVYHGPYNQRLEEYSSYKKTEPDDSQNRGKIIQTGNGTILEFQQEISETSSTDMDEGILVNDDGILPGADGFPLNSNPRTVGVSHLVDQE